MEVASPVDSHNNVNDELNKPSLSFYWKQKFSGDIECLDLCPSIASVDEQSPKTIELGLDPSVVQSLLELSSGKDLPLYVLLTTTLSVALSRYFNVDDILLGAFHSNFADASDSFSEFVFYRSQLIEQDNLKTLFSQLKHEISSSHAEDIIVKQDIDRKHNPNIPKFIDNLGLYFSTDSKARIDENSFRYLFVINKFGSDKDAAISLSINASVSDTQSFYLRQFIEFWSNTIGWLLENPENECSLFSLHTSNQYQQLLGFSKGEKVDYSTASIVGLFKEQVDRSPDKTAYNIGNDSISYKDLDVQSNKLANHLLNMSLESQSNCVLLLEKSIEYVVSVIALLKAGIVFVPVNHDAPFHRVTTILDEVKPALVIASSSVLENVDFDILEGESADGRHLILAEDLQYSYKNSKDDPLESAVQSDDLAYIMYTSGTTGKPKGVMVEHGAILNCLCSFNRQYDISINQNILQLTELNFDPSIEQLLVALLFGGSVYAVDYRAAHSITIIVNYINDNSINIVNSTPQILDQLFFDDHEFSSLNIIISGGDKLSSNLNDRLLSKGYSVFNHYGPTEATIEALTWACKKGDVVKIGRPIDNVEVYLLNSQYEMTPLGIPGEIMIAGAALARGYIGDEKLSAERFSVHSIDGLSEPKRLYKTGDIGCLLADGNVLYLGRKDRQVKVMSARINLSEIENALLQLNSVTQAIATVQSNSANSGNIIVAFVKCDGDMEPSKIKQELAAYLPDYMIPAKLIKIDQVPLKENGKVDDQALLEQLTKESFQEPNTEFEIEIAAIWREILGLEKISASADFLDLGGNSLQATRVVYKYFESFGINITLSEFFVASTIAECAKLIEDRLLQSIGDEQLEELLEE